MEMDSSGWQIISTEKKITNVTLFLIVVDSHLNQFTSLRKRNEMICKSVTFSFGADVHIIGGTDVYSNNSNVEITLKEGFHFKQEFNMSFMNRTI